MSVSSASVEQLVQRLVGTTLAGKYRVDSLLGFGGSAAVFAATHRNGHRVALKLLHPSVATDETVRSRFLREGYIANHVGHLGAVRVLDDDRLPDGSVFLVMELLDGEAFDVCEGGRKRPLKEVCHVGYQLLDVLAAAHDRGIVHRDIKPQNVFLSREGVVKILDFGLARAYQADGLQSITQTGEVFGTPAFMAPEQAIGDMDRVDAASDQWSAACTLFNLATGAYVHDARTANEMMVFCATRPARSIREVDPEIPSRIADVIDRALRFHKEERWPHVRDFQRALKLAFEASMGGSLAMPRIAVAASMPPPPEGPRVRTIRMAVAATTAMVVTGLGILAVRALVGGAHEPDGVAALDASAPPPRVEPAPSGGAEVVPSAVVEPARLASPAASSVASAKPAVGAATPRSTTRPSTAAKRDPWSAQ